MVRCTAIIPGVAIAGGASDSIIVLEAPTGRKIKLAGFCLYGNGSDPSKAQDKVEVCRCTTDSTGGVAITSSSEPVNGDVAFDPDAVVEHTITGEPGTVTPIWPFPLHPAGILERVWSLEQEMLESAIAGGICLRVSPLANLTVNGWIMWGEA